MIVIGSLEKAHLGTLEINHPNVHLLMHEEQTRHGAVEDDDVNDIELQQAVRQSMTHQPEECD